MCGIFGIVVGERAGGVTLSDSQIESMVENLFLLSESRGKEAAGIVALSGDRIRYLKRSVRAQKMIRTEAYQEFLKDVFASRSAGEPISFIGHSRLVTNGSQGLDDNNQPLATGHFVGVHNGIVVNDTTLWQKHVDLNRQFEVDSEVIYRLLDKFYGQHGQLSSAVTSTFAEIEGEASIAFLVDAERSLGLATNVGSIYFAHSAKDNIFVFASEKIFIERVLKSGPSKRIWVGSAVQQLQAGHGVIVDIDDSSQRTFSLSETELATVTDPSRRRESKFSIRESSPRRVALTRCVKCVLPHTFPFIRFDREGVCNFCNEGAPVRKDNRQTLERLIEKYRKADGSPDCIVALSGGRDSCYGLHVIKTELGLNPIAYTYDWAMVTDEARRNCARICGDLGIEHIIRSADIVRKRRNIRINVDAWLRRPALGMIPLFMAGDKQFFHYASEVSQQTEVPLVFFCGGNNLEITRFKTGFCGVQDRSTDSMLGLDAMGKLKLLAYYAKQFLLNPAYLNRSVFDTLFAFYSTYIQRGEFVYLYRYLEWNEAQISSVLAEKYGWQSASDTDSTWRIGDGTAAFYNFIYFAVAGFSEHDTFRSNQIRAGMLTREEALKLVERDNQPRYDALREYSQLVGFNLDEALSIINNIPKLK